MSWTKRAVRSSCRWDHGKAIEYAGEIGWVPVSFQVRFWWMYGEKRWKNLHMTWVALASFLPREVRNFLGLGIGRGGGRGEALIGSNLGGLLAPLTHWRLRTFSSEIPGDSSMIALLPVHQRLTTKARRTTNYDHNNNQKHPYQRSEPCLKTRSPTS